MLINVCRLPVCRNAFHCAIPVSAFRISVFRHSAGPSLIAVHGLAAVAVRVSAVAAARALVAVVVQAPAEAGEAAAAQRLAAVPPHIRGVVALRDGKSVAA